MKELAKGLDLKGLELPSEELQWLRGDFLSFDGSLIADAHFEYARLTDCDFASARAQRTCWNDAQLHQCSFRDADLAEAILLGTNLSSCSWRGPNLVAAQVIRAMVEDLDRKSTRLNSSHNSESRMPSSA
jgi:uncharacterized protein YjbI with pentapeptide repeats